MGGFDLRLSSTIAVETVGHFINASSTIFLSSIRLPPRTDPSAVMMSLQPESFILSISEPEENPAKTTECTAPILAHPSTA
jgi:hypothetical protein